MSSAGGHNQRLRYDASQIRFGEQRSDDPPPPYTSEAFPIMMAPPYAPPQSTRAKWEEVDASQPRKMWIHDINEEEQRLIKLSLGPAGAAMIGRHFYTMASEIVMPRWKHWGIWNDSWNEHFGHRYEFPDLFWPHEIEMEHESEYESVSGSDRDENIFRPPPPRRRKRKPEADLKRMAEQRIRMQRLRQRSRPLHQFRKRVALRAESLNQTDYPTLEERQQEARKILRADWIKRGIWSRHWGDEPGMFFKHEKNFGKDPATLEIPEPLEAETPPDLPSPVPTSPATGDDALPRQLRIAHQSEESSLREGYAESSRNHGSSIPTHMHTSNRGRSQQRKSIQKADTLEEAPINTEPSSHSVNGPSGFRDKHLDSEKGGRGRMLGEAQELKVAVYAAPQTGSRAVKHAHSSEYDADDVEGAGPSKRPAKSRRLSHPSIHQRTLEDATSNEHPQLRLLPTFAPPSAEDSAANRQSHTSSVQTTQPRRSTRIAALESRQATASLLPSPSGRHSPQRKRRSRKSAGARSLQAEALAPFKPRDAMKARGAKGRRGRPRKDAKPTQESRRKPGRPRKETNGIELKEANTHTTERPRRRGRPRKIMASA